MDSIQQDIYWKSHPNHKSGKRSGAYRNWKGIVLKVRVFCNDCSYGKLNRIYRQDYKMNKQN